MDATWRMHTLRESVSKSDIWKRKVEQMGEEADALRVGLEKFSQRQNRWARQQPLRVVWSVSRAHMPILSLHASLPPAHPAPPSNPNPHPTQQQQRQWQWRLCAGARWTSSSAPS